MLSGDHLSLGIDANEDIRTGQTLEFPHTLASVYGRSFWKSTQIYLKPQPITATNHDNRLIVFLLHHPSRFLPVPTKILTMPPFRLLRFMDHYILFECLWPRYQQLLQKYNSQAQIRRPSARIEVHCGSQRITLQTRAFITRTNHSEDTST
jgi:hypothetical protein